MEPIQNISRARNRLAQSARGEWIAFIDDDEVPHENWLVELWKIATDYPTVIAKGPVRRVLPQGAPQWLEALPYGGSKLPVAGALLPPRRLSGGNILVHRQKLLQLPGPDGPFDLDFGLRGGEDILAYGQIALRYPPKIRAAPGAIVEEFWTQERISEMWLLRRAFRSGQIWCDVEALLYGRHRKFLRIPYAGIRILIRLLATPLFLPQSKTRRIVWFAHLAGLLGQASVVLRARVGAYGKPGSTTNSVGGGGTSIVPSVAREDISERSSLDPAQS